jgi:phosphoglycerol transferase MdoB-like AlkP superfamily enzyme
MRKRLRILGYFALFWITFQIVIRAVFMLYNYDFSVHLTTSEIFRVFWSGLKMDVSLSGYFIMLTGLILTASVFTRSRWLFFTLNVISILGLMLSCIIVMVDLELYRHWGFRMDTTPIFYMMGAEEEAMGSVDITVVIKLMLILVTLFVCSLFVYARILARLHKKLKPTDAKTAIVLLVITALMIIPIRGSFSVAPMNTGFVYFHKTKAYANHAAINVVWNFLYSLQKSREAEYPENFFDKGHAEKCFQSLYPQSDSTTHLFALEKPNIILFILESFTADVVEPLGGMKNIAPNLSQLCKEGILFDNFYATGDRTDKGLISILSGYPAQPQTSIIKYPSKAQRLPYLNQHMLRLGYQTSFVYGGDVDFANFRSYLTNSGFDHITSDEDFADELNESKWGVHDHLVFEKAFQECDTAKNPFFKVVLSLSSHEPFDVPMERVIQGQDQEALFLNSCVYTDRSIGEFITKAKRSPWWKNTVVIFVADHGHRNPGNKLLQDKERYRIPLLMIGGAVQQDSVIHTYASQTDLANTILAQLDKPSPEFKFSKNILSKNVSSFASYYFNNGYGFVTPDSYIVYDNTGRQFLRKEGAADDQLAISKAYQQMIFSDFNAK